LEAGYREHDQRHEEHERGPDRDHTHSLDRRVQRSTAQYRKSPLLGTAQYQKGAVVPAIAMAHAVMMAVHEATPAGSASRR